MFTSLRKVWRSRCGRILVTLVIGAIGAYLGPRINLPGGSLVGALCATAIASLLNAPMEQSPNWLRSAGRSILGLSLGISVTIETFYVIREAAVPVLTMLVMLLCMALITAFVVHRLTQLPLPTALCGASPGGLAAMISLSEDLGGDAPVVASMHVVRLVSVLLVVPAVVVGVFGQPISTADAAPVVEVVSSASQSGMAWRLAVLLAAGILVGNLANRINLPAGEMIACMVLAALIGPPLLGITELPQSWRFLSQLVIGAGVGATVTRKTLRDFKPYALAGILTTAFLLFLGFSLGWLLSLVTSLDLLTCIMGSAPGGADTMFILADELGADSELVAAMHIARLVMLLLLLPILVRLANDRLERQTARELAAVDMAD